MYTVQHYPHRHPSTIPNRIRNHPFRSWSTPDPLQLFNRTERYPCDCHCCKDTHPPSVYIAYRLHHPASRPCALFDLVKQFDNSFSNVRFGGIIWVGHRYRNGTFTRYTAPCCGASRPRYCHRCAPGQFQSIAYVKLT